MCWVMVRFGQPWIDLVIDQVFIIINKALTHFLIHVFSIIDIYIFPPAHVIWNTIFD